MKLFAPILAATMMQKTEAACNAGDAVLSVTCHPDLMVELAGIFMSDINAEPPI